MALRPLTLSRRARVLCAAVLAAAAVGCSGPSGPARDLQQESSAEAVAPEATPSLAPPSPNADALPALEQPASTDVPAVGAPGALLSAYGSVWVMSHRATVLRRIDPASSRVTAEIDTGVLGCGDLVAGAGSVWVTGCGATVGLVRVDPRTDRVVMTSRLDGMGPAFAGGRFWIGTPASSGAELRTGDPDAPDDARRVVVPGLAGAAGLVALGADVWTADETSAVVYRLLASTGDVLAAIPVPAPPGDGYLILHDGAPWYVSPLHGLLVRVDPSNGSAAALGIEVDAPTEYWGIAASTAEGPEGRLWIRSGDAEVMLVDTRKNRVVRRIAVAVGRGGDVQEVDGALWVAAFTADMVQRLPL